MMGGNERKKGQKNNKAECQKSSTKVLNCFSTSIGTKRSGWCPWKPKKYKTMAASTSRGGWRERKRLKNEEIGGKVRQPALGKNGKWGQPSCGPKNKIVGKNRAKGEQESDGERLKWIKSGSRNVGKKHEGGKSGPIPARMYTTRI